MGNVNKNRISNTGADLSDLSYKCVSHAYRTRVRGFFIIGGVAGFKPTVASSFFIMV